MPVITEYTSGDAEAVWDLHVKTIRANKDGYVQNLAFHEDVRDIPRFYQAFFVLRDGGKVIGMVGLKKISSDTFEIKRLQVDAEYQGWGYGRHLMEHVFAFAKQRGVSLLRLDTSEPQTKARNLYLSLGFTTTHVETEIAGPDKERFVITFMKLAL